MKIFLRLSAMFLAVGLLGAVIWLGIRSTKSSTYVVWFGIAAAIGAPVGISLLGYAVRQSDGDLIRRLEKVPEIERLIAEASTQQERLRLLESEQTQIAEIVRLESRRQAALDRVESLERDGVRIIQELDALDEELQTLDQKESGSVARKEIGRLRERVRARNRGDFVLQIGARSYVIDHNIIEALPFGLGVMTVASFRVLEQLRRAFGERKHRQDA